MHHILFAGHDMAPSNAFPLIAKAVRDAGAQTTELLFRGKDESSSETIVIHAVLEADIALIGMSSPAKNAVFEEAVARRMLAAGKPIALFADTFGAWSREWFAPVRNYVKLLFVASTKEVAAAQKLFPDAKVIASGVTLEPSSGAELGGALTLLIQNPDARKRPQFLPSREQGECARQIAKALIAAIQ